MRELRIESCVFRRKQLSKYEQGVVINNGDSYIIDMDGFQVKSIYDWKPTPDLAMTVQERIVRTKGNK